MSTKFWRQSRCARFAFLVLALFLSAAPTLQAETWPARPVKIVIPYPAGGGGDLIGRTLAEKLSAQWGQPVLVDNRPGGNTLIGAQLVAKAQPDAYTLLLTAEHTMVVNPSLYERLPYDANRDFIPIAQLFSANLVLVGHPSIGASSMREVTAIAKSRPGALTYASVGSGSTTHINMELLKVALGNADIHHVPYKGGSEAIAAVLSGQVSMALVGYQLAQPHLEAGKLRALAIGGTKRWDLVPDVPTLAEAASVNFLPLWVGLFAPAGTPKHVVKQINEDALRVLRTPEVQVRYRTLGYEFFDYTPEKFSAFVDEERVKWSRAVRASGAKIE